MKHLGKLLALGAVLLASAKFAAADTLTGTVNINGLDTYTPTTVTFSNPATIGSATGTFSVFSGKPITINPDGSFTVSAGTETLNWVVTSILSNTIAPSPIVGFPGSTTLTVVGRGLFTETGTPTSGTSPGSFLFTSQDLQGTGHVTTFSASLGTTPVVPEPSSLILLGTGLVSSAGMMLRRRSA